MARLWPNNPSGVTGFSDGNTWEQGVQFEPTTPCTITEIRWYRHNTTSTHKPTAFRLWNKADSTIIYTAGSIPDDGVVGWQTHTLSTPKDVATSQDLILSATYPVGIPFATTAIANAPAPDTGMAKLSPYRAYRIGAGVPNGFNDFTNVTPFDVVFTATDVPEPDDPPANIDIDNSLARWFSSGGDNLRQNELPWQTYVAQQGAQVDLDTLIEKIDADGWPVVLGGVNKENLPAWLSAAGTIISAISATADTIKNWTDAPTVPAGGATSASITALSGQLQTAVLRNLTDPPGAGWTLDDTVPFVGPFVVDAPFDRLRVNITTIGPANTTYPVGGLSFLGFAWWWAPLSGGAVAGRYHTSRALVQDLYEPGRRLSGALVVVPADFEGEYELWRYTG